MVLFGIRRGRGRLAESTALTRDLDIYQSATFGNRDMMGDLVEPGAFSGALARPGAIKMLCQMTPAP